MAQRLGPELGMHSTRALDPARSGCVLFAFPHQRHLIVVGLRANPGECLRVGLRGGRSREDQQERSAASQRAPGPHLSAPQTRIWKSGLDTKSIF